jgi:S-DNA-T family DNA segregation ATPase FtsK/SpoIIIE
VLGIIHIANGSPRPELGDTSSLQQAGGALGFVVAKLLTDLLHTGYVVVPLLLLLALFGLLVVTATPVYQVPARLRHLRDRLLGRHVTEADDADTEPTVATRRRRRRTTDEVDPDMGDPAYDSPVLEGRELGKRAKGVTEAEATEAADDKVELEPPSLTPLPARVELLTLSGDCA